MTDIGEWFRGIYEKAEDAFYSLLDWLDEHNVPAYKVHDWLEDHGIPPFPAFAAALLILIGGIIFALGSAPTYTVTVTVLDGQTGLGIPNATVYLMSGSTIVASTHTAPDGTAIFQGIRKGTYTVKVDAPNYSPGRSTVMVGSDLSNATIKMEPLESHKEFCVSVQDPSGNEVSSAQVTIGAKIAKYDPDTGTYCAPVSTKTVSIMVVADGYQTYTATVSASEGSPTNPYPVTLTPTAAQAEGASYSLGAKVIGADGNALAFVPVYVYTADGKKLVQQTVTDGNGVATFSNLPAGKYLIVTTDPKTHRAVSALVQLNSDKDINLNLGSPQAYSYEGNNFIPVNEGGIDKNRISAEISEVNANGSVGKSGYIGGTAQTVRVVFNVYDAKTGNPLEGAKIQIVSADKTITKTATTGKNGEADVNIPAGEYNISVSEENYIAYSVDRNVGPTGAYISIPMHRDYAPAVVLLGMFERGGEVATLHNGDQTVLRFQVTVPYGVKKATLTVGVGEKWQEPQEILSEISVDGEVNQTYTLTKYAESVRTVPVTIAVTDSNSNLGDTPRIYWIYTVVGQDGNTTTIRGEIRPTITADVLRCGYGWAVNFKIIGQMPKPYVLYPDTPYRVHVEYARCIGGGTTPQIALYVDRNKIATAPVQAPSRFSYGTADIPLTFTPQQAGQHKIDVRLIAGSEENVVARKFTIYGVVKKVPPAYKFSVGLPHGAKIAYRGEEATVKVGVWVHEQNITSAHVVAQYVDRDGNTRSKMWDALFPPYEQWQYHDFNLVPFGNSIKITMQFLNAQGKVLYTEENTIKVTDYTVPLKVHFVDAKTGESVKGATAVFINPEHNYTFISDANGYAEKNVAIGDYNVTILPQSGYVTYTMPVHVRKDTTALKIPMHHDYNAFVSLEGMFLNDGTSVGTLPLGSTVTLRFQVGVPYNVTSAVLDVNLGAKWMEKNEITAIATINGGTSESTDLSGYAESIQTVEVPVKVADNPKNAGEHLRISWEYIYKDSNGTHVIRGHIYPAVTQDVLRCGDGWAVNFKVNGPKPAPRKLFPDTKYDVAVEYVKCDANAPQVSAVLYVDNNKAGAGSVAATERYYYGTADIPLTFTPQQAGQHKIDVRLIAGSEENVVARKFAFYTLIGQGRTICMKITTTPSVPYVGVPTTVTATPTDCNGHTVTINTREVNMIIVGGHAVDNPPLYMQRSGDKFTYSFTPVRYGDVIFDCKSTTYNCQAVKPSTVWVFARSGIEITGEKTFWVPKANHNGVRRINSATFHLFNYNVYPVQADEINVSCDDQNAEATATLPGTVQPGTYGDFTVRISYAGNRNTFKCTITTKAHATTPGGNRRYMTARYTFTVATGDMKLAVSAPSSVSIIPGVSKEFNVSVSTGSSGAEVKNVVLAAHTLDPNISVTVRPNRVDLPPGSTRSFTVVVTAKGNRRTAKITFTASGKIGLYSVRSNTATTVVKVQNPQVVEANITYPKRNTPGVNVKGTSATIDLGFYKDGKITVSIKNTTEDPIYVYPVDFVAKSEHVILSMQGKRESPAEVKANSTYTATYTISTTNNDPFKPETITLHFKIAARGAGGRIVYPVPDITFPLTFTRHSPTCLQLELGLQGGSATPGKPVAVKILNNCGFEANVSVWAPVGKVSPSGNITVPTDGNYYTLTFSKPGTYATYVYGIGQFSDIRSNTVTIKVGTVQQKKTSAEIPSCSKQGGSVKVEFFSVDDAPFKGTGDCRIDYCGYAEVKQFLAKQIQRIYTAAQTVKPIGTCKSNFCDVTGEIADTDMNIHVKYLPGIVDWHDVADLIKGVQLQVINGEFNQNAGASTLYYHGDHIQEPGTYTIHFKVYQNKYYPDEIAIDANITYDGMKKDLYNGFYAPLFINLGDYEGSGLAQTTVEPSTKTYIIIPPKAKYPVLERLVAQEVLERAFSKKRIEYSVVASPVKVTPRLEINYGNCNGLFEARVESEGNVTKITICNSAVEGISDPNNSPQVGKIAKTLYHFLAMDGSVEGCINNGVFLVRGYNEKLAQTKLTALNNVYVMPGVWAERTLVFNVGVQGVPRTFKILSVAVDGADDKDVNITLPSKKIKPNKLKKDKTFTVGPDGSVDANIYLNPKASYKDTVSVVVGLQDTVSKQTFLGVIHIHPVAVKESDLIKTAIAPNYLLPGNSNSRYPIQLLENLKQAFFAVDGDNDQLDREQIFNDIVANLGGMDELINRANNREMNLPVYVYHDLDSCYAVYGRIWSTLQDAAYQNYVVSADLKNAKGEKCQLRQVGVYATKFLGKEIGSMRGVAVFGGACTATTMMCDIATAALSGGAGLFTALGDIAGCGLAPFAAGKGIEFTAGTIEKAVPVSMGATSIGAAAVTAGFIKKSILGKSGPKTVRSPAAELIRSRMKEYSTAAEAETGDLAKAIEKIQGGLIKNVDTQAGKDAKEVATEIIFGQLAGTPSATEGVKIADTLAENPQALAELIKKNPELAASYEDVAKALLAEDPELLKAAALSAEKGGEYVLDDILGIEGVRKAILEQIQDNPQYLKDIRLQTEGGMSWSIGRDALIKALKSEDGVELLKRYPDLFVTDATRDIIKNSISLQRDDRSVAAKLVNILANDPESSQEVKKFFEDIASENPEAQKFLKTYGEQAKVVADAKWIRLTATDSHGTEHVLNVISTRKFITTEYGKTHLYKELLSKDSVEKALLRHADELPEIRKGMMDAAKEIADKELARGLESVLPSSKEIAEKMGRDKTLLKHVREILNKEELQKEESIKIIIPANEDGEALIKGIVEDAFKKEYKGALAEAYAKNKDAVEEALKNVDAKNLAEDLKDIQNEADLKTLAARYVKDDFPDVEDIIKSDETLEKALKEQGVLSKMNAEDIKKILIEKGIPEEEAGALAKELAENPEGAVPDLKKALLKADLEKALEPYGLTPKDIDDILSKVEKEGTVTADSLKQAVVETLVSKRLDVGKTLEELAEAEREGIITPEEFRAEAEKILGSRNLKEYGIEEVVEGEKVMYKVDTDTVNKKLAEDIISSDNPAGKLSKTSSGIKSALDLVLGKWGRIDNWWREYFLTRSKALQRVYKYGEEHPIRAGFICAAVGQAAGTAFLWGTLPKTPDSIITVEGNLADGLYVVAKSGNMEWNVAVGIQK